MPYAAVTAALLYDYGNVPHHLARNLGETLFSTFYCNDYRNDLNFV
jgi:hypothetical protein